MKRTVKLGFLPKLISNCWKVIVKTLCYRTGADNTGTKEIYKKLSAELAKRKKAVYKIST